MWLRSVRSSAPCRTTECSRSASPRRSRRPTMSGSSRGCSRSSGVDVDGRCDSGDRGRGRRGCRPHGGPLMRRCAECSVDVEGTWRTCPLCRARLEGDGCGEPFPVIPLEFSRRRVLRTLFLTSLAVIVLSFAAQLLFNRDSDGIGVLRSLWLGVAAMWLVVGHGSAQAAQCRKGHRVPRRAGGACPSRTGTTRPAGTAGRSRMRCPVCAHARSWPSSSRCG